MLIKEQIIEKIVELQEISNKINQLLNKHSKTKLSDVWEIEDGLECFEYPKLLLKKSKLQTEIIKMILGV